MRSLATIHTVLRDVKALTRRTVEETDARGFRERWNRLIVVAALPLSLLFAWGFLHLILVLIFPGAPVGH
jgi:hypothetical protein